MSRLLMVLAWLAVAALVLAALLYDQETPEAGVTGARLLAMSADAPLAFALDPGEEEVKLVTWVASPPPWARDTRAMQAYRLDLSVLDAQGETVWAGRLWRRARRSWLRLPSGTLLRPAFLPRSPLDVSDSRVDRVDVAGLVPEGGRLQVQASVVSPGSTVLLTAYRYAWRTKAARLRVLAGAHRATNDAMASRVVDGGWQDLPTSWQETLAGRVWERLSALPDPQGHAVDTVQLVSSAPEEPWESQPALGYSVAPGGAVAFNLRKGAVLRARWMDRSGRRVAPAPTWVQRVHADGTSEVAFLGVLDQLGPFPVDEPLESLHLALDPHTEGARVLEARLEGAPDAGGAPPIWGDPPMIRGTPAEGWLVSPDIRTLELFRTGPDRPPLVFPVEQDGELLRLSIRPRMDAGALPAFGLSWDPEQNTTDELPPQAGAPVALTVRALAADGKELGTWQALVPSVPSSFERYSQADDPGSARCAEPEDRFLIPPVGAARLEVTASAVADVGLRVFQADNPPMALARAYELPALLAPPARAPTVTRLPVWAAGRPPEAHGFKVARYEPYAQDPWRARSPLDQDELMAEDRMVRVDAQVRLEPFGAWMFDEAWMSDQPLPVPEEETPAQAPALERHALDLEGPYELVVEPDRDDRHAAGARTLLSTRPSRVQVKPSGRLDIDYRVAASEAGRSLNVKVDGVVSSHRLLSSAGRLRLAGLQPGDHQVSVDAAGTFLARSLGERPWQVRRVIRLSPDSPVTIAVPGSEGSLAIYSYGADAWLDWQLQGGNVARRPGLLDQATPRSGRLHLRPEGGEARPLSFAAADIARLSPLLLHIGPDAGSQPMTLELRLTGTEEPVWIRATASWARGASAGARRARVVDR